VLHVPERTFSARAPDLTPGARHLLYLVRRRGPLTRAQIGDLTGWARDTVTARLDELQGHQLLRPSGVTVGPRGRPAVNFEFDSSRGRLLVADVGATSAVLARCDLAGTVLSSTGLALRIEDGPDLVLGGIITALHQLQLDDPTPVWGVGVDLPGPVEHPTGRVVSPPIMTGWNGLAVPSRFSPHFNCPIVVENDADAMAWGEWEQGSSSKDDRYSPGNQDLLFLKVGTGIGAGIVSNGALVRGANGAAGDLGHTYIEVANREPPLCRCGNSGCVEAYAGGWAIVRDLACDGLDVSGVSDVLRLLQAGDPDARRRVREAGRVLGIGLASAVSLFNPAEVVIGGQLAAAGEDLLAGIRERIAARSLPLATQDLIIRTSRLGHRAGLVGLAAAVVQSVFQDNKQAVK